MKSAKTDQEKAVAYYWLGVAISRQGRFREATNYQRKAIALDPSYGAPYSSLALEYYKLRENIVICGLNRKRDSLIKNCPTTW